MRHSNVILRRITGCICLFETVTAKRVAVVAPGVLASLGARVNSCELIAGSVPGGYSSCTNS